MYRFAILVAALVLATGCRTTQPPSESVRPGVNKNYLTPDLDPSKWVERFEREGREVYDLREAMVEAMNLQPGDAVADLGAGTGLHVTLLSEAVGPKGKVYAVDIVPKFIQLIDRRMKDLGIQNVETVLCTERSAELKPNSIDKVFSCDTYHHLEYPGDTMGSIFKALRPGGEVYLVDFEKIEGQSSDWIIGHVRAPKETVIAEMKSFGFVFVEELDVGLKNNYLIRFRNP